jgi:hypothetical protein
MRKLALLTACLALGSGIAARAADAAVAATATVPEVDHMVYLTFLPEPSELMADAKANGLTILRLDQTADKVIVSYKYPDGHTATLGYARLGSSSASNRVRERTVVETRPVDREVVYVERPYTRVVYRDPYWDDFWVPLTLGVGLGWVISDGHGWHGGYHGGWHGGGHWRH